MSYTLTFVIMACGAALFGWGNYKSRQELDIGETHMISPIAIQFVGIVIVILMGAHLITLVTGTPFAGRRG